MKKIVIVEDEALAAAELKRMILAMRPTYHVLEVLSSKEEMQQYFKQKPAVDLLFLDVELSDGNSMEGLDKLNIQIPIIFCTAYPEFAVDAFDTPAISYLLKPFSKEKLLGAIEKFESQFAPVGTENQDFILINSEYRNIRIECKEILFLESIDDYIKIHLQNGKTYSTLMSMKKMLEKLPEDSFVRIHRSFIVPLFRIEFVRGKIVSLGFKELPLGITHEEQFYKKYLRNGF